MKNATVKRFTLEFSQARGFSFDHTSQSFDPASQLSEIAEGAGCDKSQVGPIMQKHNKIWRWMELELFRLYIISFLFLLVHFWAVMFAIVLPIGIYWQRPKYAVLAAAAVCWHFFPWCTKFAYACCPSQEFRSSNAQIIPQQTAKHFFSFFWLMTLCWISSTWISG